MLRKIVFAFTALIAFLGRCAHSQVAYTRHLSELRIQELRSIAIRLEHSVNSDRYACESYFDYVCSRNRPLFSILGNLPEVPALIQLFAELQEDDQRFEAKEKVFDFFISCTTLKSVDDCYRETFVYFKPLFAYIIVKNHIDASAHEHRDFLELLERFLAKAGEMEDFQRNPVRLKLITLKEKFRMPQIYFRAGDLNREYGALKIYRESYQHNVRNLQHHRKRNSTFEEGVQFTMLNWSLYLYQSRNKPMSYYFSTLSVHLWMTLYNSTARTLNYQRVKEIALCLKLPQFVYVLGEARILAIVYLKSFQNAWQDYREWITSTAVNQEIFDHENEILKAHHLDNKRLFFTLYAQNFCDFGKEFAESVFYLGLKHNQDFYSIYSCGYQTESRLDCV